MSVSLLTDAVPPLGAPGLAGAGLRQNMKAKMPLSHLGIQHESHCKCSLASVTSAYCIGQHKCINEALPASQEVILHRSGLDNNSTLLMS